MRCMAYIGCYKNLWSCDLLACGGNDKPYIANVLTHNIPGRLVFFIIVQWPAIIGDLNRTVCTSGGSKQRSIHTFACNQIICREKWRPCCGTFFITVGCIRSVLGKEIKRHALIIHKEGTKLLIVSQADGRPSRGSSGCFGSLRYRF